MKKTTKQNQASQKENTSGSSERQISQEPVKVPEDIKSPKHARAYAHAFNAARNGTFLKFVAPAYRWAIARGWKAGEDARRFDRYIAAKRIEFQNIALQHAIETDTTPF